MHVVDILVLVFVYMPTLAQGSDVARPTHTHLLCVATAR